VDDRTTAASFGFHLGIYGDKRTEVAYWRQDHTLSVDRRASDQATFTPGFAAVHRSSLMPVGGRVRMTILVDRCSIELFANDGRVVFTELDFHPDGSRIAVFAEGGEVRLISLTVYELAPAQ
jgi:levanbiose-producing levanase